MSRAASDHARTKSLRTTRVMISNDLTDEPPLDNIKRRRRLHFSRTTTINLNTFLTFVLENRLQDSIVGKKGERKRIMNRD